MTPTYFAPGLGDNTVSHSEHAVAESTASASSGTNRVGRVFVLARTSDGHCTISEEDSRKLSIRVIHKAGADVVAQ